MDLEKLKGATLDDKTFGELQSYVTGLAEQRDAARQESINGRKGKDAKVKELTELNGKLMEKLGIESPDDIDSLPDAKGQAEAVKQFQTKLTKAERELAERTKALEEATGKLTAHQREAAMTAALDGLRFKHVGDVRALLMPRVVQEADQLLFKTDDGKLVPLREGAEWFAKTRPDYVEAQGGGGSGSGFKGNGGGGGATKGDLGGDRAARVAAIASKFPELAGKA